MTRPDRQWLNLMARDDIFYLATSGFLSSPDRGAWRGPRLSIQRFGGQESALLVAYGVGGFVTGWLRVDRAVLHLLYVVEPCRRRGIASALWRRASALGYQVDDLPVCVQGGELGAAFRQGHPTSEPAELAWAGDRGPLPR